MILLINNNVKALIYNAFRVKFSSTFAKLKFKTNQATTVGILPNHFEVVKDVSDLVSRLECINCIPLKT